MKIILGYDIALTGDEKGGQKRLRKTFQVCKKYLHHIQKSFFEGELTVGQLQKLKNELSQVIDNSMDSVVIFSLKSRTSYEKETMGVSEDFTGNFL